MEWTDGRRMRTQNKSGSHVLEHVVIGEMKRSNLHTCDR